MTMPTLYLVAPAGYSQRIGGMLLRGEMRIVDASGRGVPPNGFLQMASVIFAGRNVYDAFSANKC